MGELKIGGEIRKPNRQSDRPIAGRVERERLVSFNPDTELIGTSSDSA